MRRSLPSRGRQSRAHSSVTRLVFVLASVLALLFSASSRAAQFTVDSTADSNECAATCSLRGAVEAADASPDASSRVTVPAGTYDLLPANKSNPDGVGQLRLTNAAGRTIEIIGAGVGATIVNAGKGDRVLRVAGGGADVVEGMTLEGGQPTEVDGTLEESVRGAGILQIGGMLELKRVRVSENEDSGWGGGVDVESHGTLELLESELDGDIATSGGGGAINLEPGILIATGSSLDGDNSLSGTGGALQLLKGSTATLTNDTLAEDGFIGSGDTYEGGAVFMEASTAAFTNDTFSDDAALGNTHGGADISANEGSHVTLENVLLGAPTGGEPEEQACNERFSTPLSTWTDLGGNLAADTTCNLAEADMGVSLALGELGNNGGPTETVPLLAGSPAIDHGVEGCPTTDQRGYARVGTCDSGSFEFAAVPAEEKKPSVTEERKVQVTPAVEHAQSPSGPSIEAVERVLLGCSKSELVLSDVYAQGRRVVIRGSAAKSLAGKHVRILVNGKRQVASALVEADGQYAATAPLPAAHGRALAATRYLAQIGSLRSLNLKLTRRLALEAPVAAGTTVTLSGQVVPPLTKPPSPIVVEQELECGKPTVVKKFTPSRNGRYRITLDLPAGTRAAIFRLSSTVAANAHSVTRGFSTYSLPLPVDISTAP